MRSPITDKQENKGTRSVTLNWSPCAKEIDIAATLEHLRDQRPGMVQTKEQFEFALTAVAEEVNAILKALPQ
ncbi:hypothetical protein U0070_024849 [Myodes glareolus]|uniref:Tyrosine-protein phosphatase domain-containing protein n=1 Tax=Myodes glareolus TaxID=447135 RepID=A0AAW0I0X5_MYOGA